MSTGSPALRMQHRFAEPPVHHVAVLGGGTAGMVSALPPST